MDAQMSRLRFVGFFGAALGVATLASHLGYRWYCVQLVRWTTWNLECFPNGSAHDASPKEQDRRIIDAAAVLKPLHPDILLLQEVVMMTHVVVSECYPSGAYHIEFAPDYKEPFRSGLGRQQVAILRDFRRKRLGRNSGNLWRKFTRLEDLRLHGSRFEIQIRGVFRAFEEQFDYPWEQRG